MFADVNTHLFATAISLCEIKNQIGLFENFVFWGLKDTDDWQGVMTS